MKRFRGNTHTPTDPNLTYYMIDNTWISSDNINKTIEDYYDPRTVNPTPNPPKDKRDIYYIPTTFTDLLDIFTDHTMYCDNCSKEFITRSPKNHQKNISKTRTIIFCSSKCKKSMLKTKKQDRKRYYYNWQEKYYGFIYMIETPKGSYVGKSIRAPFTRWLEHMGQKEWLTPFKPHELRFSILYSLEASTDTSIDATKLASLEKHYIDTIEPIYNKQGVRW